MNLSRIVCSGPNEHTEIADLVALMRQFPKAEIGVQVSGKKAGFGSARYWWLEALYSYMRLKGETFSVALHVNSDWVEKLTQGEESWLLQSTSFQISVLSCHIMRKTPIL